MIHLPGLIEDLGFILLTAAAVTILFRALKQPVVLGYLLAGLLVGPHIPLIPTITDTESITVWAEIGVIFLLFGLGLEFSFKKLAHVGKSASITALFEILFMLVVGYLIGQMFGWSNIDSLFLGGILSISSTTIIIRAFEELGLKGKKFVSLVFGVLIVEDLGAILLLVVLSTVAVTQSLAGGELAYSALKLGFFMLLWFVVGIYLLPFALRKTKRFLTDETLLIVSLGLCLMMVIIATHSGFSPALGAFVMGSLFAETLEGHRIERLIIPVRDLFAAIFFVSVGMMIDPSVLVEYFPAISVIVLATIFGKLFSSALGALISGQTLKTSLQTGMSLAQIGEFSFIIATLGLTLEVTSPFLYPVAVAVSAVTTFTTPYLIRLSSPLAVRIEHALPAAFRDRLTRYQRALEGGQAKKNALSLVWSSYGTKILLNSVLVIALALAIKAAVFPTLSTYIEDPELAGLIGATLALLLSSPFMWGLLLGPPSGSALKEAGQIYRLRYLQMGVVVVRMAIGSVLVGFVILQFTSFNNLSALLLAAFTFFLIFISRRAASVYQNFEKSFLENLDEKERVELEERAKTPVLAPWDATLTDFVLSPNSDLVGKSLQASSLKEHFGVTVALLERGHQRIVAPKGSELLMPYDRIYLIGDEEQTAKARSLIEGSSEGALKPEGGRAPYGLESLMIADDSKYVSKTVRTSGIREDINGLIVGIERETQRILNPDPSLVLQAGDQLWIVGNHEKIDRLRSNEQH